MSSQRQKKEKLTLNNTSMKDVMSKREKLISTSKRVNKSFRSEHLLSSRGRSSSILGREKSSSFSECRRSGSVSPRSCKSAFSGVHKSEEKYYCRPTTADTPPPPEKK